MKAVVAAFNQEKAQVGAFSVITNLRMELFEALLDIYFHLHGEHGHGVHGGDDAGEGEDLHRLEGVGEVVVGGGAVGDGLGRQLAHEVQLQHRDQESTDHKEVEQCALASRG